LTTLALAAVRSRTGLVGALFAVATACWIVTAVEMSGMNDGPWTSLGAAGWFLGVWLAMTAAMMLPSVWPTVALYSRMGEARSARAPLLFTGSYLATWGAFGALAFAVSAAGERVVGEVIAWDRYGRWVAGATLIAAGIYELTPLKEACLDRCRSPFQSLFDAWRTGPRGALELGARHGAWCIGCCWALMASLFALGIMSVAWSALIAAVIAGQKMLEHRRVATYGTVALLIVFAALVVTSPEGRIPV
jgi:predicted metal-binding membrane protein